MFPNNINLQKKKKIRKAQKQRLIKENFMGSIFRSCEDEPMEPNQQFQGYIGSSPKNKIITKKSTPNLSQTLEYPFPTSFVFNLYSMISINENSIQNQQIDESFFKGLFRFHKINKVESTDQYLYFEVTKNRQNFVSIDYMIQRFKSKGDQYFYDIACKIEKIHNFFSKMNLSQSTRKPILGNKSNFIPKIMQQYSGKMFFLRLPHKLYLSKELIQLMGLTIQELQFECMNYNSLLYDIFSTTNYKSELQKFFHLYDMGIMYKNGFLSQKDYLDQTNYTNVQYILNRKNKLIKAKVRKENFMPGIGITLIEEVISQNELQEPKKKIQYLKNQARKFMSNKINSNISTLANLNIVSKGTKKFCSYIDKIDQNSDNY